MGISDLFRPDPTKAWDANIAALRRRRDPLDHALADQQERCPTNPRNGGDGQSTARYPTVEQQAGQTRQPAGGVPCRNARCGRAMHRGGR